MAEQTALRNNALPYPIYGAPYGVTFPLLDSDGDPISPSAPDSEISLNGDTFADCTNEAVEIATTSGICYLLLTAAEMTSDVVTVQVKSTGAKTTVLTFYPRKLVPLRAGTAQGGAAGSITLDAGAGALDDLWNGCVCVATIDSNVEARMIDDYVGSTQVASVTPDWNVTPDSDDTFIIYLPEGRNINLADLQAWLGTVPATPTVAGVPEVDLTHVAGVTTNVSTLATGVAALPTAAVNADAVWDEARSGHVAIGSFGQGLQVTRANTVGSGSTSSDLVLDASASATDDFYNGMVVHIIDGPGKGESAYISDYVGSTKTCTILGTWDVTPTTASQYVIIGV